MRPHSIFTRILTLQNSLLGDVVWAEFSAGLLGKEPTALVLMQARLRKAVSPKYCGVGLSVSMLGNQYRHCAASHSWLSVYAEQLGRKMASVNSFVP